MHPNKVLLWVDDNNDVLALAKAWVQKKFCDWNLVTASHVAGALVQYHNNKPTAVVLDIILKDYTNVNEKQSGFDICKHIRAFEEQNNIEPCIIIISTAMIDDFIKLEAIVAKADYTFIKDENYNAELVFSKIEELYELRFGRSEVTESKKSMFSISDKNLIIIGFCILFTLTLLIGSGLFVGQLMYHAHESGQLEQAKRDWDAEQARRFDDWTIERSKENVKRDQEIQELKNEMRGLEEHNRAVREAMAAHGIMNNVK